MTTDEAIEDGRQGGILVPTDERAERCEDAENAVKAENERLRELCVEMWTVIFENNTWWDWNSGDAKRFARLLLELGVQLDGAASSTARLLREWGIKVAYDD